MGNLIGYARVSTTGQSLDLQTDALEKAGCTKIFTDKVSGGKASRPGLDECLNYLRDGDTLVAWKIDRVGRSLAHLASIMTSLNERGISFKSLTEPLDTTTAGGEFIFHVFAAMAQMERSLNRERTLAGLEAAKQRGKKLGRPEALSQVELDLARRLRDEGASLSMLAKKFNVSKTTMHRRLSQPSTSDEVETRPAAS